MTHLSWRENSPVVDGIKTAGNAITAALFAPACPVCNAVLDEPLSGCVCAGCWRAVREITAPVCDRCGDPMARDPMPKERAACRRCRNGGWIIDRSRAVGEYDGILREVIHSFKYGGRRSLAAPLAVRMRFRGVEVLDSADAVAPVPLHWRRQYHRGFNQAYELARHLNRPLLNALARIRHTRAQVELTAERRRTNIRGAFVLRRSECRSSIQGLKIVLVDDVSTTGATLEECASVLKEAGASAVYALTAARVVTRPGSQH